MFSFCRFLCVFCSSFRVVTAWTYVDTKMSPQDFHVLAGISFWRFQFLPAFMSTPPSFMCLCQQFQSSDSLDTHIHIYIYTNVAAGFALASRHVVSTVSAFTGFYGNPPRPEKNKSCVCPSSCAPHPRQKRLHTIYSTEQVNIEL